MVQPRVTIVIVPRERFGSSIASLESVYDNTAIPFKLIYVDGNSPPAVAKQLSEQSRRKNFELIREDEFLVPNRARNLGFSKVETEYVVFMDNDIFVTPGWLENMITCAKETGAAIVAPVYLEGKLENRVIHMANAISRIEKRSGRNYYVEKRLYDKQILDVVQDKLTREAAELFEFHCVLMRSDLFSISELMPDEISNLEHSHLSMRILDAGYSIYFEPKSVVTYDYSYPFYVSDLPFFHFRWGQAISRRSLKFFKDYWSLADDDPFVAQAQLWVADHRRVPRLNDRVIEKIVGKRAGSLLERAFLKFYRNYANFKNNKRLPSAAARAV